MNTCPLMIGKEFIFNKTQKKYKILAESKMKNPQTREWQDCVIYQQSNGEVEPMTFVREKQEFLEKFSEVNPNLVNMYYGLSGTFKSSTIKHKLKFDPEGIPVWSEIKTWKTFENKLFPDLIPQSNLNLALLHLTNLKRISGCYDKTIYIERGITDMIFYENPDLSEDIIKRAVELEIGIVGGDSVRKVLLVQKDVDFLTTHVLHDKIRSNVFPGGVNEYLEKQDKYVEFTKKHNHIDKVIEITNAKEYLRNLGVDFNEQMINNL